MSTNTKMAEESTMNDTLPPLPESVTAAIEVFAVACRFDKGDAARIAAGRTLCDAISEALAAHDAEQAQEPVAWRVWRGDSYELFFNEEAAKRRCECFIRKGKPEPIYAAPVEQAAKAVPAGFVLVPVEVLEDAATAIGHFVSDHGWSDEDMQAMDNLDAYIARHKANAAPATPGPAPDCED